MTAFGWYTWSAAYRLLIATAIIVLAGCGDRGPQRVIVSGLVTFNGKPLADGMIRFLPTADSQVPVSGSPIVEGAYCVKNRGGVPVGTYKVLIEGYRPMTLPTGVVGPMPPHSKDGVAKGQFLPPKYNTQTQLDAVIAPGSREATKSFELID